VNSEDFTRSRWIGRVTDFGLLGALAASRPRLQIAAGVGIATTIGYGVLVADHVQHHSGSVTANVALISVHFVMIFLTAYVLAMAAGATLWGDEWRRRVLQGERPNLLDDVDELDIERFKDNTLPFYGLVLLGLVVTYTAVGMTTDRYVERYNQYGYYLTQLRSPDPADRVDAIRTIVQPWRAASAADPDVRAAVVAALDDDEGEVRTWAAWASGHLLLAEGRPALIASLQDSSAELEERRQAAHALGRLADPEGERRMIAMLSSSIGDPELTSALMTGLGLMASSDAGEPIAAMLGMLPPEVEPIAFWALGKSRRTDLRESVRAIDPGDDLQRHCALAEALQHVTTVDDDDWLREQFESIPHDTMCEAVEYADLSWDDPEDMVPITYVNAELLRSKYMVAVFNVADRGYRAWLEGILMDESEELGVRLLAEDLLELLESGPARPPRE